MELKLLMLIVRTLQGGAAVAHKSIRGLWKSFASAAAVAGFILVLVAYGACEVKFDGSSVAKGSTASLPGPNYTVEAGMGTQMGRNLFHSFGIFNIATGESATFTGTGATGPVSNIIGRVTGGSPSSIDGTLRSTISGANLYLMNPYGIMFGPKASIDVNGSFHATTADYLRMADNAKFYADLGKASTLSIESVAAFGFLSAAPAPITVEGSLLINQQPRTTISLIGGDLEIKGIPADPPEMGGAYIASAGGQINLISVASPGEVIVNQPGESPSVDVSSFSKLGNISISGFSAADVSGIDADGEAGSGTIIVRAGKLQMTTGAFFAQTYRDVPGNTLGIDIAVTGDMVAEQSSIIQAASVGTGRGSDILIKAGNLYIQDGSYINTATVGPGQGGNTTVIVDNDLNLLRGGEISANTTDVGTGGNVTVTARNILIQGDQASVDFAATVDAAGGDTAGLWTNIAAQAQGGGAGGNVSITTDTLRILGAGFISTNLFGPLQAGNIDIQAKDVRISGMIFESATGIDQHSRIESRLMYPDASGTGGNISVITDSLRLGDGGYIGTYLAYDAPGDARNITVRANSITMDPRGKIESSSVMGTGNSGDIDITAGQINITGVGTYTGERIDITGVRSDTKDGISGGNIHLSANTVSVSAGGQITSESSGAGKGGSIAINANTLQLQRDAVVSAKSTGAGNAGDLTFKLGSLAMTGSTISTDAAIADGGNIDLRAGSIVSLLGSHITAGVGGGPTTVGGNIFIDPAYVVLNNSSIVANAFEGRGGNIRIVAGVFLASSDSLVSASSQMGIDGTVDVRAPITSVSGTLAPVRASYLGGAEVLHDRCVALLQGANRSTLTIRGRDGLPPRPGNVLPASIF
jgi:filamentous hemagglutinin family protein